MNAQTEALRLFYQQQQRELERQNQILELQRQQLAAQQAQRNSALAAQADAQTKAIMEEFTGIRPDWPRHEQAMLAYAMKLPPGDLDPLTYLDTLYFLARRDEIEQERHRAAESRTDRLF